MITDKEYEEFLPKYNDLRKIGTKKKMIAVLRELGYTDIKSFQEMMEDERQWIYRMGNTYYITGA